MTVDEYWKKYNRCPKCVGYNIQGRFCDNCKWKWGDGSYCKNTDFDKFQATDECMRSMTREVTE